jgi:hypothetical protein
MVGLALAGKASDATPQKLMALTPASSRLKPVPLSDRVHTAALMVLTLTSSRLKPVLLRDRVHTAELMARTLTSSRLKPVPLRERVHTAELMARTLTSSRLKPVLQADRDSTDSPQSPSGTGFSREGVGRHTTELRAFTPASSTQDFSG